ncbi:hypothetical protein COBT_001931 [Conglomerata obtusa]
MVCKIFLTVLAGALITLLIFCSTLFVQLPKNTSKNNTLPTNAKVSKIPQRFNAKSTPMYTTGWQNHNDTSFTSLSANAYSFNIDKANSKIAKNLAYYKGKCDGKVLNINSNPKHQKDKIDIITVEEFLRNKTTTSDSDIQNIANEDQIIESIFGNKTKYYIDTQDNLYLTVIKEDNKFLTIDIANYIEVNGSKLNENNITLDKIRNHYYDKSISYNEIKCFAKNQNPLNNKQNNTAFFKSFDLKSLEYIGFGQKSHGKDVFFVHTNEKKFDEINLEDCKRLSFQELPTNAQESITNFINSASHVLRFHDFKSVLLYNELVYLQVNDNLAYLFVKDSFNGKNFFTDEINRINNITELFFEQKNPKITPRFLLKFCDKKIYHLLNAETAAVHSLLYPLCVGRIVKIIENTKNGMTSYNNHIAFKSISKCLYERNAGSSTYQLKAYKSIEREYNSEVLQEEQN